MQLGKLFYGSLISLCLFVASALGDQVAVNGDIYSMDEASSKSLDMTDPLRSYKKKFAIPFDAEGKRITYLSANTIGLAPLEAKRDMQKEFIKWEGISSGKLQKKSNSWYSFHTQFLNNFTKILGAEPEELAIMNSLSTNLHLAMVSFYKPTTARFKIIMASPVYISDVYIVKSQMKFHGINPDEALIIVEPSGGNKFVTNEDFNKAFEDNKNAVSLMIVSNVNHLTGQILDAEPLSKMAHDNGAKLGLNLAHSIGNIPLKLHKWNVDFAVWCNYKYISAGPGAVGGLFIHKTHTRNPNLHRFSGWWGSDPSTRESPDIEFIPTNTAEGWQPSEPSVFSMIPLRSSLKIFNDVGVSALREKSIRVTAYLEYLIDNVNAKGVEIITPRDPEQRGAQLSLRIKDNANEFFQELENQNIICDLQQENILRVTLSPLYNGYHDAWVFANALSKFFKNETIQ